MGQVSTTRSPRRRLSDPPGAWDDPSGGSMHGRFGQVWRWLSHIQTIQWLIQGAQWALEQLGWKLIPAAVVGMVFAIWGYLSRLPGPLIGVAALGTATLTVVFLN